MSTAESKPCLGCKGSGKGNLLRPTPYDCVWCDGVGSFEPVDREKILQSIRVTRGSNKGRLLSSASEKRIGRRAYYVWRLARFHGGADVHIPMVIDGTKYDPFKDELEALVNEVAAAEFGTVTGAARRWAPLLGLGQSRRGR